MSVCVFVCLFVCGWVGGRARAHANHISLVLLLFSPQR